MRYSIQAAIDEPQDVDTLPPSDEISEMFADLDAEIHALHCELAVRPGDVTMCGRLNYLTNRRHDLERGIA